LDFSDFGFDLSLMEGIEAMGYETPTPIQQKAIPAILEGRDIMGSAQTGTGKTAAFLLPVIQKIIASGKSGGTRALVIVPTRELAMQIDQHMEGFSYFTPVGSIAVYGGGDGALFAREKKALLEGTEVVVCTPGRMISHLNNTYVNFSTVEYLVLDEADRMLDMGFYDDIMKIIQYLPKQRQNLMFAATMPEAPPDHAPSEGPRFEERDRLLFHEGICKTTGASAEKGGTAGTGYSFGPGPENQGGDHAPVPEPEAEHTGGH
jgi:ATP-dependent RNA helicase RhlE